MSDVRVTNDTEHVRAAGSLRLSIESFSTKGVKSSSRHGAVNMTSGMNRIVASCRQCRS